MGAFTPTQKVVVVRGHYAPREPLTKAEVARAKRADSAWKKERARVMWWTCGHIPRSAHLRRWLFSKINTSEQKQ